MTDSTDQPEETVGPTNPLGLTYHMLRLEANPTNPLAPKLVADPNYRASPINGYTVTKMLNFSSDLNLAGAVRQTIFDSVNAGDAGVLILAIAHWTSGERAERNLSGIERCKVYNPRDFVYSAESFGAVAREQAKMDRIGMLDVEGYSKNVDGSYDGVRHFEDHVNDVMLRIITDIHVLSQQVEFLQMQEITRSTQLNGQMQLVGLVAQALRMLQTSQTPPPSACPAPAPEPPRPNGPAPATVEQVLDAAAATVANKLAALDIAKKAEEELRAQRAQAYSAAAASLKQAQDEPIEVTASATMSEAVTGVVSEAGAAGIVRRVSPDTHAASEAVTNDVDTYVDRAYVPTNVTPPRPPRVLSVDLKAPLDGPDAEEVRQLFMTADHDPTGAILTTTATFNPGSITVDLGPATPAAGAP